MRQCGQQLLMPTARDTLAVRRGRMPPSSQGRMPPMPPRRHFPPQRIANRDWQLRPRTGPSLLSGFVNTRTGNPCNCCCPGMHDSLHNHPPPVLVFSLQLGPLWSGSSCPDPITGFLVGSLIRPQCPGGLGLGADGCFSEALGYEGTDICHDLPCPPDTGAGDCTVTWTCVGSGNTKTCTSSPRYLPWNCNNFCCNCLCLYNVALNSDGTINTTSPDPTYADTSGISFSCQGNYGKRGGCTNLARAQCDFFASIRINDLSTLCPGGSNTCPPCNPVTGICAGGSGYTGPDCDGHFGPGNWMDCRPFCDPNTTGTIECNATYGVNGWLPGVTPLDPVYLFFTDCMKSFGGGDSVIGCNPCIYCDPEFDDCGELTDGPLDASRLASSYGKPCNPCAMPGYPNCNPKFWCMLTGPCGSSMEVWAP